MLIKLCELHNVNYANVCPECTTYGGPNGRKFNDVFVQDRNGDTYNEIAESSTREANKISENLCADIDHEGQFDNMDKVERCIEGKNSCKSNKYMREVLPGIWIDVYDVIEAFNVSDGGMQHAIKKMLAAGQRGHKNEATDRKDILASVKRSNEIFNRKRSYE